MQIKTSVAALLLLAAVATAAPVLAQAGDRAPADKLGLWFDLKLNYLQPTGSGLVLGVKDDVTQPGLDGDTVDSNWVGRFDPEIGIGVRLPDRKGTLHFNLFQFDQNLEIFEDAGENQVIGNTWSTPIPVGLQGRWDEDLNDDGSVGGVDWNVSSVTDDLGDIIPTEPDGTPLDQPYFDAAEDLNNNGRNDPFVFQTSSGIKARHSIDNKVFDLDYGRLLKETEKFRLDAFGGLRFAKITQKLDLRYRQDGAFAAYSDDEASSRSGPACSQRIDATGDDYADQNEGDGYGNGNGSRVSVGGCTGSNVLVEDELTSIPIRTEESIQASVETRGSGLRLGLRGEYRITKSLLFTSTLGVSAMWGQTKYSMKSTLTRQRDAQPNFIDWDLNGDGRFDQSDFDFNGDGVVDSTDWADPCADIYLNGGTNPDCQRKPVRNGIQGSIENTPLGTQANPYADGRIDEGDPIPDSERNTTIYTNQSLLRDDRGDESRFFSEIEMDLGLRYEFSPVASLTFGLRGTRWFDVGTLRNVGQGDLSDLGSGDLSMHGFFLTLTIWPKGGTGR